MADDKKNTGPADDKRVNVNQDYEVRYWTRTLGCTADELKACVKSVGVMVVDVRACLAKKKR